jgi:hypothetical protein
LLEITLDACERQFVIRSSDAEVLALIEPVFGSLVSDRPSTYAAAREYQIDRDGAAYRVATSRIDSTFEDIAALIFHIDKEITVALQHLRPDLLFMHGAALAFRERAIVLSAPPGTGKSTLTLVALRHGLDYFSDELAPIDLQQLTVWAYPRSVFLKTAPPEPHRLPPHAITHHGRHYVPRASPTQNAQGSEAKLAGLIFLRRDSERFNGLRRISAASGAARVMANSLNLLAHPSAGLDAAIHLSRTTPCFELDVTDLDLASLAIKSALSA